MPDDLLAEHAYITISVPVGGVETDATLATNLSTNGQIRRLLAAAIIQCADDGYEWADAP